MSCPRRGTSMPEELLDRKAEGVLLVHRRDIVEPVEIRHRLQVGLVLDQLLGAAVEKPDMRIDPLDDLAVELQHKPQHAVRGRMLRPEVDREVSDVVLGHGLRTRANGEWRMANGETSWSALPRFCAARDRIRVRSLLPRTSDLVQERAAMVSCFTRRTRCDRMRCVSSSFERALSDPEETARRMPASPGHAPRRCSLRPKTAARRIWEVMAEHLLPWESGA